MAGPFERGEPSHRRLLVVGVGGAALMAFALAALWAVTTPPFAAIDEAAHVGYAITLAGGDLPTLDTWIPHREVPGLLQWLARQMRPNPHRLVVWTSNHPPLPYVLLAPGAAWAASGSLAGLIAMRLTMAACLSAAVAATGWLAREVVPTRPSAALVAASALAIVPALVQHSGLVFTDVVVVATGTATLAAAVRVLRRGPSRGALTAVALLATAAALSRATGVVIAGLAVAAVAVAGWRVAGDAASGERLRRAVRTAAPAAATVTVGGAWFYIRNWVIMGGPAGSGALLELTGRQPRESMLPALVDPWKWSEWARYQLEILIGEEPSLWPLAALLALIGAAAVAAALAVRHAGGAAVVRRRVRGDPGLAWSWVMLALLVAVCVVTMVQWWSQGGNPHARYLYPAAPVLAVALGLIAATWRVRWVAGLLALGGVVATVALLSVYHFLDRAPLGVTVWTGVALIGAVTVLRAGAGLDRRSGGAVPAGVAHHGEGTGER